MRDGCRGRQPDRAYSAVLLSHHVSSEDCFDGISSAMMAATRTASLQPATSAQAWLQCEPYALEQGHSSGSVMQHKRL